MLLYFIVYYAMGLTITIGMGLITMIKVYKKGYDLEHFTEFVNKRINKEYTYVCTDCGETYYSRRNKIIGVIFGYSIWPIRIFENRHYTRDIIDMYEKHLEESK